MLTPAAVKAAQPMARAYKLFDAGGLFLFVAPSGLKSWRYKCQRAGRERLITLRRYHRSNVRCEMSGVGYHNAHTLIEAIPASDAPR